MKTKEEIEKLSYKYSDKVNMFNDWTSHSIADAVTYGYTQCQEDMAHKKYTEEDLHNLLRARRQLYSHTDENVLKVFINSLNKQD